MKLTISKTTAKPLMVICQAIVHNHVKFLQEGPRKGDAVVDPDKLKKSGFTYSQILGLARLAEQIGDTLDRDKRKHGR